MIIIKVNLQKRKIYLGQLQSYFPTDCYAEHRIDNMFEPLCLLLITTKNTSTQVKGQNQSRSQEIHLNYALNCAGMIIERTYAYIQLEQFSHIKQKIL